MPQRSLPSDVSPEIHQILAKAMYAVLEHEVGVNSVTFTRAELEAAAEAQFEYDVADDGAILFRRARV